MSTDAAIAANRFGFGARPGDLARLGSRAREALLVQLDGAPPLLTDPALSGSQQLLAQTYAQREEALAGRAGAAAPGSADAQNGAVKLAQLLREVFLPAYTADVTARVRQAITSERDFTERLVHFWSNHFAVSIDKAAVLGLAGSLEREAIRPHVLGKFTDMLLAVEQHPAMLLYLDNQQSIGPNSELAKLADRRGRDLGLNENLGREILELHTLGVDAGYTQADVRALASMITGWSIGGGAAQARGRAAQLRGGGEPGAFYFRAAFHEPGSQQLLGRRYGEDGLGQGVSALRDLALDPHTARHVSTKLARHFVADEPPAALVERMTQAWMDSRGDLPSVYRALINSPESWQQPLAKFKTPTDYIYSAFRMLALPLQGRAQEIRMFEMLGQRAFAPGSPAGWPDRSADWDGSSALLKRLELAQQLGQRLGTNRDAGQLAEATLGAVLSADTRTSIARAEDGAQALTLLLAAPEFMRR